MDEQFELQLAGLVAAFSEAFDATLRSQLADLLVPVVESRALTIARRIGLRDPDDFAAEAVWELITPRPEAPLPRICMWHPTLGRFGAWLGSTLSRLACSRLRCTQTSRALIYDLSTSADEGERRSQETRALAVYETPFPNTDHQTMSLWGAEYRLELTLIGGLWVKFQFTPEMWQQVLREYETSRAIRLPDPFSPAPLLTALNPGSRVSQIASVLGYSGINGRNKLWRRWERNQFLLLELECLREFRGTVPEP